MKIFCIPGGGTPSSVFFRWKAMLRKNAEVIILDYPERDILKKNHQFGTVSEISEYLFHKIQNQLADDRSIFLSSCTGCMIAYELYRLAEKNHCRLPEKILAFSAFAPDTLYYAKQTWLREENRSHIYSIYHTLFSSEIFSQPEQCAEICSDFLIQHSELQFPEIKLLPETETYEKKSMLDFANQTVSMILYDWKIAEEYAHHHTEFTPVQADVYAIRGKNDTVVSEQDTCKWKYFTNQKFEYKILDGSHNLITSNADACIALTKSLI